MKKFICLFLIFSMLIPLGVIANEEGNILFESSFEEDMKGWSFYNNNSILNAKISELCSTDGKKSVYIIDDKTDESFGVTTDYIEIEGGKTYSVSVDSYMVEGSVSVFFKIFDENKTRLIHQSKAIKPGNWQNIVINLDAPENAKYCQINLVSIVTSTGKGYFDNVKVREGKAEAYEVMGGTIPQKEESNEPYAPEIDTSKFKPTITDGEILYTESFENGIENWSQFSKDFAANVIVTEEKARDGKKSVFISDTFENGAPGIRSPYIEIKGGEMYTASGYLYNVNNSSVKLWLKYFDKDKNSVFSTSASSNYEGVWTEVSCTGNAPEDAMYAQIYIAGVNATKGDVYADLVSLRKGAYKATLPQIKYIAPKQAQPQDAKLVAPVDNKLKYTPYNEQGDTIGDYSYAGFYGGDYELPVSDNLPVVATLSPTGKDDTAVIQTAINKAERKDGGINIVKLKAGTYYINSQGLRLKSGVLLSGEGQGPTGTEIFAYSPEQYSVIKISGEAPAEVGKKVIISDEYLKAGSKTLNIPPEDASNFKVGDRIAISHISTEEWAKAIGMVGTINVYDNVTTWLPGGIKMVTERIITKINGGEITLDFAIFVPHIKELVPSYIVKVDDSKKVENAGVENLRIVSYYNGDPADENHAATAVSITNAKNIFVRDITGKHMYFSVVHSGAKAVNVTARNVSSIEPISQVAGSRRYSFEASSSAQQILYTGCYSSEGRHDFVTHTGITGPISFVDNVADASSTASESHMAWSTGILYDNLYQIGHNTKGFIAFANRGIWGTVTSHGWSAASAIAWNCLSSAIVVHKPPLSYQNFSVGLWGLYNDPSAMSVKEGVIVSQKNGYRTGESTEHTEANFATDKNTSFVGDGYKEAMYTPVNPRSLYKAQLSERYTGVISNARPNTPIIIYPKYDKKSDDNKVTVSGLYQLGAEKVTVYIDNVAYNAALKSETNEFEFTTTLSEGVHKIYATQTIDGVEGNKNADRFITIGKENGNPEYLQSIYSPDKLRMITNDPRLTYDQIINGIKVKINNNLLYSDVLPYETQGRVLVPMRAIFEKLNASVLWDDKTATATASKDGIEVKITENSTKAYVNGNEVILDVPATIISGRFVVPVRFISESFGAKVGWIDETKTVTIEN